MFDITQEEDYRELTLEEQYLVNGGAAMDQRDQAAMADAQAKGDQATMDAIRAKYDTSKNDSASGGKTSYGTGTSGNPGTGSGNGGVTGSGGNNNTSTSGGGPSGSPGGSGPESGGSDNRGYPSSMDGMKNKNTPGYYIIDHDKKVVKANIKDFNSIEEAYCSYYILGDRGYTFELCDNGLTVHTFKDTDTVDYYIQRTRNWERNNYQDDKYQTLKEAEKACEKEKLKELPYGKSVCHKQGFSPDYDTSKNRKFVSLDGKQEYVFNENGALVTDPVNKGTYNYCSPDNLLGHATQDLIPWIKWGTGPDDPTSKIDRLLVTITFGKVKYTGNLY